MTETFWSETGRKRKVYKHHQLETTKPNKDLNKMTGTLEHRMSGHGNGHGAGSKKGSHSEKKHPHRETIDKIIEHYQSHNHKKGKPFEERIEKFEEFYDSENIHQKQLALEAEYIAFGKPDDRENYPGLYDVAYKVLSKHAKDDNAKITDEGKLTEILETYVDKFLETVLGDEVGEMIKRVKEHGGDKKAIRELKGQLFGRYHTDEQGRSVNILADAYINRLKGKKKIELIEQLKGIANITKQRYGQYLLSRPLEGVLVEEDRIAMADYIKPIFEKQGFTHEDHPVTKSVEKQAAEYAALLQGGEGHKELEKADYKYKVKDHPKPKKDHAHHHPEPAAHPGH